MKILITGSNGMLGRTLCSEYKKIGWDVIGADINEFDITDKEAVRDFIISCKPEVVVHTAAMTDVDVCETEQARAFLVNCTGTENIALAAQEVAAKLIYISTDYVFSGDLGRPYKEKDSVNPRTVYGKSKLAGEEAVVTHCDDYAICRIAWLYGPGGPSFVHTMLKLGAEEDGEPLKVVNDQHGNPTSTFAVADEIKNIIDNFATGLFHMSCHKDATWYDFAREIFSNAGLRRPLIPCSTAEFPRPAPRPKDSRLENTALSLYGLPPMPKWKKALKDFLRIEMKRIKDND